MLILSVTGDINSDDFYSTLLHIVRKNKKPVSLKNVFNKAVKIIFLHLDLTNMSFYSHCYKMGTMYKGHLQHLDMMIVVKKSAVYPFVTQKHFYTKFQLTDKLELFIHGYLVDIF